MNFSDTKFSASFATLHAGDRVVALILGLRSGDVYHTWMTSYDTEFAAYSPGRILFSRLVQSLPELGIRRLDFGGGDEQFKWHFANGYTPLWEGAVDLRPLAPTARFAWLKARDRVKKSPFRQWIHTPWSLLRPLRDRVTY